MIKNKIYIFGIVGIVLLIIFGCKNAASNNVSLKEKENLIANNSDSDLNGIWGLTNYFDTIVANKELAKYRLQTPTWFAIFIEIKDDSLKCFGSIEQAKYPIKRTNDTLAILSSDISDWYLIRKELDLQLIQISSKENIMIDSTIYIFRKREDLKDCINKDNYYGITVTQYFNDILFKGKYINVETKQEVIFAENGKLIGIEGFNTYEVRDYFGTLHYLYNNLDVITFSNSENEDEYKQYNWVFSEDELILTEFVPEKIYKIIDEDGSSHNVWEFVILGKKKIRLKKIENKTE